MSSEARSPRRAPLGLPAWVVVPAVVGIAFVGLPLISTAFRVDWGHFLGLVLSQSSLIALRLSLVTTITATVLCLIVGVPLSLLLARMSGIWSRILRGAVLTPLILPPVVSGLALLYLWGQNGWLGQTFALFGIRIAFSTAAVVLAQTFVSLPFLVLALEGAFRSVGERYDDVAASLGSSPSYTTARVTLPLVRPALVAGTLLVFARALGEFGATLTFAGSLQGVTRTLPLEIYLQRETQVSGAVALSMILVVFAFVLALIAYGRGVDRWR